MRRRIVIVYNEPEPSRSYRNGEEKAVVDVINSVEAVFKSLLELEYEVMLLPLAPPFSKAMKKLKTLHNDVVFNLFEGFYNEPESEPQVAAALSELEITYTGCRAGVLKLALDKARVKKILKEAGISTPDFQLLSPATLDTFRLDFPCIVKPRADDASNGITADSLVYDFSSLEKQVRLVSKSYRSGALVECFIDGREFNATVMGTAQIEVLPVSEIVYSLAPDTPRILTYAAKWETESSYYKGTQVVCPAKVTPQEQRKITDIVMFVFKLIVGSGYARVDMRMDKAGNLNIIEVNPNPDISPDAGAALQSRAAGMNYTEFINKIVNFALERNDDDVENTPDDNQRQTGVASNVEKHTRI